MATIDYKEKYEQALEVAQRFYNNSVAITKKGLEDIFPELAGSEDEKIRKALLNEFIHLQSKGYKFAGLEGEDIISWLEKQGMPAKYHDICDTCVRQPTCQSDCFLQQSEQMPIDKVEPKFKIGQIIKKEGFNTGFTIASIINGFYYNDEGDYFPFTDQDNWELVEQKSAWSEEDEQLYNDLSDTYFYNDEDYPEDTYKLMLKRVLDWMTKRAKSLRPQPKQLYWTEEEIEPIISDYLRGAENYGGMIGRLRCLKPQSQWKPSEEQMYSLNWVANVLLKQDGIVEKETSKILDSLYNDLKKLK